MRRRLVVRGTQVCEFESFVEQERVEIGELRLTSHIGRSREGGVESGSVVFLERVEEELTVRCRCGDGMVSTMTRRG